MPGVKMEPDNLIEEYYKLKFENEGMKEVIKHLYDRNERLEEQILMKLSPPVSYKMDTLTDISNYRVRNYIRWSMQDIYQMVETEQMQLMDEGGRREFIQLIMASLERKTFPMVKEEVLKNLVRFLTTDKFRQKEREAAFG